MTELVASPNYKTALIDISISENILSFGHFSLKSGRKSPYFFDAGQFHQARSQRALGKGFANTLAASGLQFDVVFGPVYKGITLAALTVDKLLDVQQDTGEGTQGIQYDQVSWSFNRKEKKDHGEGGCIVGASLKDKRVVIVDDVITAGTAIRDSINMIEAEGGHLVGIVVAFNRQERLDETTSESALGAVQREYGVPVMAILTLQDVLDYLKRQGSENDVKALEAYREKYQSSDSWNGDSHVHLQTSSRNR